MASLVSNALSALYVFGQHYYYFTANSNGTLTSHGLYLPSPYYECDHTYFPDPNNPLRYFFNATQSYDGGLTISDVVTGYIDFIAGYGSFTYVIQTVNNLPISVSHTFSKL